MLWRIVGFFKGMKRQFMLNVYTKGDGGLLVVNSDTGEFSRKIGFWILKKECGYGMVKNISVVIVLIDLLF